MTMDNDKYHRLLIMLFALTNQFRSFMDDRPGLTKDLQTGQTNMRALHLDSFILEDLNQLTELEEQSVVLEENLWRMMKEISTSRRCMSQRLRHVNKLRSQLENLQADLRAAIKFLEGRSRRKYRRSILRRRRRRRKFKLKHKESQARERCPLHSQSCPNIPEGLLEDSKFHFFKKWSSLNRTIEFKDSWNDILESFNNDLEIFELSCKRIMDNLEQTWHINVYQPQQLNPGPRSRGHENSSLPSSQAAGQDLRLEFQPSTSDSSRAREAACYATSHRSDQSVSHQRVRRDATQPNISAHRATILAPPSQRVRRDTTQPNIVDHRATILPPPSQNFTGISHSGTSAQQDNESHSTREGKAMHEARTAMKTVSAESSGSPTVSLTNISTTIYKTMAASCAAIFIFLSF